MTGRRGRAGGYRGAALTLEGGVGGGVGSSSTAPVRKVPSDRFFFGAADRSRLVPAPSRDRPAACLRRATTAASPTPRPCRRPGGGPGCSCSDPSGLALQRRSSAAHRRERQAPGGCHPAPWPRPRTSWPWVRPNRPCCRAGQPPRSRPPTPRPVRRSPGVLGAITQPRQHLDRHREAPALSLTATPTRF